MSTAVQGCFGGSRVREPGSFYLTAPPFWGPASWHPLPCGSRPLSTTTLEHRKLHLEAPFPLPVQAPGLVLFLSECAPPTAPGGTPLPSPRSQQHLTPLGPQEPELVVPGAPQDGEALTSTGAVASQRDPSGLQRVRIQWSFWSSVGCSALPLPPSNPCRPPVLQKPDSLCFRPLRFSCPASVVW